MFRILVVLSALSAPMLAQYAGPAILSRGQAPSSISRAQISFRPFVQVRASYDTALSGVGVDQDGQLGNASSLGTGIVWGLSGSHSWKHTFVGVDYRGSMNHYAKQTYYDAVNQSAVFSLVHQFSPNVTLAVSQSGGSFSRDFGLGGLQQSVAFDPATTYIPTTDYFDNRTSYYATQANLSYQRTRRLSFMITGAFSVARRRSAALFGSAAESAGGDVQYRLTQRNTIGAMYQYTHFGFGGAFATTDVHSALGSYSYALTRRSELSVYGGVSHVETKYIQTTKIDPVIAALLGVTASQQIVHNLANMATAGGRISHAFHRGVAYVNGGYRVTPGNGLFLTSYSIYSTAGYNSATQRRWSYGFLATYDRSESVANYKGGYSTAAGSLRLARIIYGGAHAVASYSLRRYDSPNFPGYQRVVQQLSVGIAYAPGEVPLRMW